MKFLTPGTAVHHQLKTSSFVIILIHNHMIGNGILMGREAARLLKKGRLWRVAGWHTSKA